MQLTSAILFSMSAIYATAVYFFYLIDRKQNDDKFSAIKIVSYFAWIEVFVMAWFSIRPNAIEKYIYAGIADEYKNDNYLIYSYFLSISSYIFFNIGMQSRKIIKFESIGKYLISKDFENPQFAILMWACGLTTYFLFIQSIGGLGNLWSNISLRTTLTAGLGYFQAAYVFMISAAIPFIYPSLMRRRKFLLLTILFLTSALALISLGQRSPLAFLVFCVIIVHNYRVKKITRLLNIKYIFVTLSMLIFMFGFVQFRGMDNSLKLSELVERDIIQRLGTIERQVVVVGYFDENPFWGAGVYESLLLAPIPRSLYPDKPPVDTGVYINNIRFGRQINPPVPVADLEASSWPDGFLAGYVSFGYFGLAILAFVSGLFIGSVYQWFIKNSSAPGAAFIYANLIYFGAKPLSPLNIVSILLFFAFILIFKNIAILLKSLRLT